MYKLPTPLCASFKLDPFLSAGFEAALNIPDRSGLDADIAVTSRTLNPSPSHSQ